MKEKKTESLSGAFPDDVRKKGEGRNFPYRFVCTIEDEVVFFLNVGL